MRWHFLLYPYILFTYIEQTLSYSRTPPTSPKIHPPAFPHCPIPVQTHHSWKGTKSPSLHQPKSTRQPLKWQCQLPADNSTKSCFFLCFKLILSFTYFIHTGLFPLCHLVQLTASKIFWRLHKTVELIYSSKQAFNTIFHIRNICRISYKWKCTVFHNGRSYDYRQQP